MKKNKFFIKICNDLVLLYDYSATINKKINHFFEKKQSYLFYRFPTVKDKEDPFKELGYERTNISKQKNITRANKCYLILLSPLIIVLIFSLSKAMFSWMFIKNMTLFFDEYVKLILLIPIFILLFTWILPSLFFKLFYPNEKKHISIYTYGILISIIFPLLVIPQDYHHYKGNLIETIGTVLDKNTYRKSRSITFSTKKID